jgi:hypothetical protein
LIATGAHHNLAVSSPHARATPSTVSARTPTLPPRPGTGSGFKGENNVIVLGLVLLVVGFLLHISILWTLGIILLVIGAILAILGGTGRMVGGRRHWY